MTEKIQYQDHVKHYQYDGEYYDYFRVDKFMKQEIRRRYQEFFHLLKVRKNDRVLEIGSGGGHALNILNKKSVWYSPVDIPYHNLQRIREKASFPVFPAAADAYHLPFRPESFDAVIMGEVLEHLETPLAALKDVFRVVKKGGKLIVSVPYKEKLNFQICIHCNKPTPVHAHLHSFDDRSLSDVIARAGFTPRKISKNCNKVPNRLHVNLLLKKVPFRWWNIMDKATHLLIDKPISLIVLADK